MLLNCGVGEYSWESLGLQGDPTSPFYRSVPGVHWKDWCWSWNSNTLATWCEELTHLKRPWCWEGLREGGEGDNRGWDGWMASPTQWTWVSVNSRSWWWTGWPGVLQSMGSQSVGHPWVTEQNWTDYPGGSTVVKRTLQSGLFFTLYKGRVHLFSPLKVFRILSCGQISGEKTLPSSFCFCFFFLHMDDQLLKHLCMSVCVCL